MTPDKPAHIEPSRHSTPEVDEALDLVQGNVDATPGAGSPAIKPDPAQHDDNGKPSADKDA